MSDPIKHECAVSMVHLRRDLDYYIRKYGTPLYGYRKLVLLLEKQHNRGQDGAGVACVRLDPTPGELCYSLEKSDRDVPLADLLERIGKQTASMPEGDMTGKFAKANYPFCGELYLGHLRYGTFGRGGWMRAIPLSTPAHS